MVGMNQPPTAPFSGRAAPWPSADAEPVARSVRVSADRWSAKKRDAPMNVLAGIAIVAIGFFAGASFWTVTRAPARLLRLLLNDSEELGRVIQFLSPAKVDSGPISMP